MRVAGYVRVSRVGGREGESFVSPELQKELIAGYCSKRGYSVVAWHEDYDQTGGRMARPAFDEMIRSVQAREIDLICISNFDRFGRTLVGALVTMKEIREAGGDIASVDQDFDTTTPHGELMLNITLSMAQFELRRIEQNWKRVRSKAIARGVFIGRTPFGYRREQQRLVPSEDAPLVRRAFEMAASGVPFVEICRYLNANKSEGIETFFRGNYLRRYVLTNRVYLGEATSGEYVNLEAHEPLIDEATFQVAGTFARATSSAAKRGRETFLLSGMVYCGGCRRKMTPSAKNHAYRCRKTHQKSVCQAPASIDVATLDAHILEHVRGALEDIAVQETDSDELDLARMARDATQASLGEFLADESFQDEFGYDAYKERLRTLRGRAERAKTEYDLLMARQQSSATLSGWAEVWEALDDDDRSAVLRSSIDAIVVRAVGRGYRVDPATRVRIFDRGDVLPVALAHQGKVVPLEPFPWDDEPALAGPSLQGSEER